MGCMSKIRWRIDWWGNIQYPSISGWCNVKMCQMCQMWNITDIRHNLKMLRWHARWHERAFSLFVTYFLFPWQNHWCWWQTEHPIKFPIFGIFENFKIFSYPPICGMGSWHLNLLNSTRFTKILKNWTYLRYLMFSFFYLWCKAKIQHFTSSRISISRKFCRFGRIFVSFSNRRRTFESSQKVLFQGLYQC